MHALVLATAALGMSGGVIAQANSAEVEGCMRLLGSVACPGFQYAYLSPSNLSNAFPFFSEVTDVRTFDVAALNYFSDPYQFRTTKFINQLGCYNASEATIRYQRTVLCSIWVNTRWSDQCLQYYNGTSAATSQKMVCQQTCLDYSKSEYNLVNDTTYCPGPDFTNGNRSFQLNKDFVDCTDWTTLATNDTQTCVLGDDNEPNCGFGSSTAQLCAHCLGPNPDDCCYESSTDISVCGYVLPVRSNSTATSSVNPAQTSGDLQGSTGSSDSDLSGGQIAGIVVGSVIGGLLLLAGLVLLALFCLRRRKAATRPHQPNTSEKGLLGLGSQPSAVRSSPNMMDENTLYASSGMAAKSAESNLLGMAPVVPAAGTSALAMGGVGATGGMGAAGGVVGERGGVVLPRVRDENANDERYIETGAEVMVLWPYQATLPDELDLRPGMKLKVLRLYDDAWGTGQVISGGGEDSTEGGSGGGNGKQGAFPIVCVSEGSSIRASSQSSSLSH